MDLSKIEEKEGLGPQNMLIEGKMQNKDKI
jgi:hypothetical protein